MSEPKFLKTAAFGGYEKVGVIRKMEYLNTQIHELGNKLTEAKLLLEAYKKGSDDDKAQESVLANERARLTQTQVQNDTLTAKLKAVEEENRNLSQEIKRLNETCAALEAQRKTAEERIAAMEAENEAAALSNVFIEAQKSAAMLESNAKDKCDAMEETARILAESVVEEANTEAEQIIYEANKTAQQIIADAKNETADLSAASTNLRASVIGDVEALQDELAKCRAFVEEFTAHSHSTLSQAETLMQQSRDRLTKGGIPVFTTPEHVEPTLPPQPPTLAEKMRESAIAEEEKQKKQQDLEKLKRMADNLKGNDSASSPAPETAPQPTQPAGGTNGTGGKIDLAALAAQANAIGKS